MRRRDFIGGLGGAAATWPLAARAQQDERARRIGVLVASPANDAEWQARVAAFKEGLAQLGWTEGRNVRIDTRWATTNADDLRKHAAELVASTPHVLVGARRHYNRGGIAAGDPHCADRLRYCHRPG